MIICPPASEAKTTEALNVIGSQQVGTRQMSLFQQIFVACALGGGGGPPDPGSTLLLADGSGGSLLLADGVSFLLLAS